MEQAKNIESAINSLVGVISSRVILRDAKGHIDEIHVLADPSRNPKQVSKDIQSLFAVQLNSEIDHRKISVATVNMLLPKQDEPRPKFVGIEYATIDGQLKVVVHLSAGEQHLVGHSGGVASDRRNLKYVALATIEAVTPLLKQGETLMLEDWDIATLNKQSVALVSLALASETEEYTLVGSSVINDNIYESVVKATLDALNRKLFS